MTYFAKPHESFCRENLSFLRKHLRNIVYDSGILPLLNTDMLHDTHYKHFKMEFKNEDDFISVQFQVSYITEADSASSKIGKLLGM
jgi:hypothetical protein